MTDAEEWWDGMSAKQKNEVWCKHFKHQSRAQAAISIINEAGLFAQIVRHPEAMRQSWADGSETMDCGEASRMLNAAAEELEEKIAAFLEPNTEASRDEGGERL